MAGFPQLIEEDLKRFDAALGELLAKSEASTALIVEKAGYLIHQCGNRDLFDATTVATLGSNAFNATQFMAGLVNETNFKELYQQGENVSTLMLNVDENCLLVIVFNAALSVGAVKYYAAPAARHIAGQLRVAQQRAPGAGLDLSDLNPADARGLFERKQAPTL